MCVGPFGCPLKSFSFFAVNQLRLKRGILIVEAIVAAFLMLFAFAAACSLFDASLRWEAESGNLRRANMVAEKKMEELRALTQSVPSGRSFSQVLQDLVGPQAEYEEAPGFSIMVSILPNSHDIVPTSGLKPTDGVHSPCSSMYTEQPTSGENPPDDNPQLNNLYRTYPYTRHLQDSLKLVEVSVSYGSNSQPVRLVSLLGDPVAPLSSSPSAEHVKVTKVSGPDDLNGSDTAIYTAQVVTAGGSHPKDVTVLWSLSLQSTGSLTFLPLDSSARQVKVERRTTLTPAGSDAKVRLQALVRYGGREVTGLSPTIDLP